MRNRHLMSTHLHPIPQKYPMKTIPAVAIPNFKQRKKRPAEDAEPAESDKPAKQPYKREESRLPPRLLRRSS